MESTLPTEPALPLSIYKCYSIVSVQNKEKDRGKENHLWVRRELERVLSRPCAKPLIKTGPSTKGLWLHLRAEKATDLNMWAKGKNQMKWPLGVI